MKEKIPLKITLGILAGTIFFLVLGASIPSLSVPMAKFIFEKTGSARLALLFNRTDAGLWFAAGNHYFGGGAYDIERALAYYGRATDLDSSLPGLHYQLARVNFLYGNLSLALSEIDKELKIAPEFKKSYYVKGLIQGYAGKTAEAAENFKKYIVHDPINWAAFNDLAWVYFKQGNYTNTKQAALRGLELDPENPWLNNALGAALLNLGDKEGAAFRFERALRGLERLSPTDWGSAYPGNDPRSYERGFAEMKKSIAANLELVRGDVNID